MLVLVCCLSVVVCGVTFVVLCLLLAVGGGLRVRVYWLCVACCLLIIVRCSLLVACCLLFVVCSLLVFCLLLLVALCVFACCLFLFLAPCLMLCICCLLDVVRCLLFVGDLPFL